MSNDSSGFVLHVTNYPAELNEEGLIQLFSEYGEVLNVLYRPTFAYITYPSYKEAEEAIRNLDRARPLELHIQISKKQVDKIQNHQSIDRSEQVAERPINLVQDFRNKNTRIPEQCGVVPNQLKHIAPPHDFVPRRPGPDEDCYYPSEVSSKMFDLYDNPHPHYHTNLMWCRGRTQITPDGRRQVHMGRGYTWYEVPPPKESCVHQITEIYEQRNPHCYQFESGTFDDDDGPCMLCGQPAKYNCFQCKGLYCSTGCQARDWPMHQNICVAMPKLVHKSGIKAGPENGRRATTPNEQSDNSSVRTCESPRLPHVNPFDEPRRTRPRQFFPMAPAVTALPKSPFSIQIPPEKQTSSPKMSPKVSPKVSQKISPPKVASPKLLEKTSPKVTSPKYLQKISPKVAPLISSARSVLNPEPRKPQTESRTSEPEQLKTSFKKPEPEQLKTSFKKPEPEQLKTSFKKPEPVQQTQNDFKKPGEHLSAALSVKKQVEKSITSDENIDFAFQKLFISDEPVEVSIVSGLGNSTYWVHKVSEQSELAMVMEQLQEEVKSWPNVNPVIGQMYVLPYMDLWHRVKVVKMNPLTIEYVDFGGEEVVENSKFKAMSVGVREIPPYAAKIKFNTNEKFEPEDTVEVKLVKKEGGLMIVTRATKPEVRSYPKKPEVLDKVIEVASDKPVEDLESVLSYLMINEKGFLQIHTPLRNGVFSVALVPESIAEEFCQLDEMLHQECNQKLPKNRGYKPAVGEIVAAVKDDSWIRAKVISCDERIQVIACDEGRVLLVDEVLPLPVKYGRMPASAVTCEFLEIDKTLLSDDGFQFVVDDTKIVDKKPCVYIHYLAADGKKKKCVIKPWVPDVEQKGVSYVTINPNSKVIITAYKDHHRLYVRSLDTEEVEKFNRLTQDISAYGSYAQPMTKMPIQGQMVVAFYQEDRNFYRALVKDIKNEKIQIQYLDFGNLETTTLKNLYEIPQEYKAQHSAVRLVTLKDVPSDVPMKKEVAEYLDMLVGEERQLVVKFDDIQQGVELFDDNKKNINEIIKGILVPSWKGADAAKEVETCFMLGDMPKTKLGKVGDVVEATILDKIVDGYGYYMCVLELEKLDYVEGAMRDALNKYAKSVKEHYIPRTYELCIAPFDGNYYRAYCYEPSVSPTEAALMFVDYGNIATIPHKEIRHMTKDFMEPSPLGTLCEIQNMIPESMKDIPERLKTRLQELLAQHSQVKAKIVDYDEETLTHIVEIEEVTRKLKEEKLI